MIRPRRQFGFTTWVAVYTLLFWGVFALMERFGGPDPSGVAADLVTAFMVATVSALVELRLDGDPQLRPANYLMTLLAVALWLLIGLGTLPRLRATGGTLSLGLFCLLFSIGPELARKGWQRLKAKFAR